VLRGRGPAAVRAFHISWAGVLFGLETKFAAFPTPAELWQRFQHGSGLAAAPEAAERLLAPFHHEARREPRYYQRLALQAGKPDAEGLAEVVAGEGWGHIFLKMPLEELARTLFKRTQ
jgi:hypothetical protein